MTELTENQVGIKKPSIVTIGGGTGNFTVLSGLKHYPVDLTAVVAMTDNAGSSGVLRDDLGVLPPGDIRQCLVALSEADDVMRELFVHRFANGGLAGHNFGNLFISALEQVTGDFSNALERAADILKIRGRVMLVTLSNVQVSMELKNGKVLEGEHAITSYQLVSKFGVERMWLTPEAVLNPKVEEALTNADLIVVGPGNFYSSLIPNFLVAGMAEAFMRAPGRKVFVANLMNKFGQTDGFGIADYLQEFSRLTGLSGFDEVLYNNRQPEPDILKKYVDEGEPLQVSEPSQALCREVGADILADTLFEGPKKDLLRRTLIRHDSDKLAQALLAILQTSQPVVHPSFTNVAS